MNPGALVVSCVRISFRARWFLLGCALGSVGWSQTLLTGLVGYWNFDEGSGTTMNDWSGTGNNGTLVNGGDAWVSGHFGSAIYFPGTAGLGSTRVEIPNSLSLQITSAITFAAWVRVDNIDSDAPIMAKEGPGGLLSYWFGTFPTGHFGLLLDADGNQPWTADNRNEGGIESGAWVHLASTWDGTTMINYLNGTVVSSGVAFGGTVHVSAAFLAIGVNSNYVSEPNATAFTGIVDDLYLYNRALSVTEINQLMASPIPEPATTAMLTGVLVCAAAGWKHRKRRLGG